MKWGGVRNGGAKPALLHRLVWGAVVERRLERWLSAAAVGNGNDRRILAARVLEVRSDLYQHLLRRGYAMPVSVAAKWSSRGEPRFVKTGCLMH